MLHRRSIRGSFSCSGSTGTSRTRSTAVADWPRSVFNIERSARDDRIGRRRWARRRSAILNRITTCFRTRHIPRPASCTETRHRCSSTAGDFIAQRLKGHSPTFHTPLEQIISQTSARAGRRCALLALEQQLTLCGSALNEAFLFPNVTLLLFLLRQCRHAIPDDLCLNKT